MDRMQPVYTETNNCQDCYKCIRECPVKAIRIESDRASIVRDLCIFCGRCTLICPSGAKKVRDDVSRVKRMLRRDKPVFVSLAPSFVAEFAAYPVNELIAGLGMLGFTGVSETALGAERVTAETSCLLQQSASGIFISSACPSAVDYIRKYRPELTSCIVGLHSPLMAHAAMLRQWFGDDIRVVFIGPCVAKKNESDDFNSLIDAALTFKDLRAWFEEEGILPGLVRMNGPSKFVPYSAADGALYPLDGGMTTTLRNAVSSPDVSYMHISGMENIKAALDGVSALQCNVKLFLELLVCDGGCINGPGITSQKGTIVKNLQIEQYRKARASGIHKTGFSVDFPGIRSAFCTVSQPVRSPDYSESDIQEALRTVGKTSKADELNCGGCGYNSCRDFAIAMISGMAERQMCVSYMRRVAADKASVLLQRMPYGVVLVDDSLHVIESNKVFAELAGNDLPALWEVRPGLKGADLRKMISNHKVFLNVLSSGNDLIDKNIDEKGRLMNLSVFTIQRHRIVCGIIQDLHQPEVMQEQVVRRIRQVVRENMGTVQKVAFLLGENAARTEAMLNALVTEQEKV
ncbi:MAG: 4Fe-4S binding protein [Lentimicrobium sp.]|uniref:[Fe-Fe] hydrogenase large subunit C-terminal domain-containing protein n=1 Tax=Lentimicrobium sp. TaxID=2034841 RepID=UPI0025FAE94D|nr:[Fe-Fe] hydrogenase large subunit C-terminal domain-containing protein [Lentimicrobium sp.]MCO5257843.1 4Fe-4S binding protein [Lentimicrobium sp.]